MKNRARFMGILVVAVTCLVVTGGIAFAHVYQDDTTLSIKGPKGTHAPGSAVRFTGTLSADHHSCFVSQKVSLYNVNTGHFVATTTTGIRGGWALKANVGQSDTPFLAHYNGHVGGIHPHSHICVSSSSDTVMVQVGNS